MSNIYRLHTLYQRASPNALCPIRVVHISSMKQRYAETILLGVRFGWWMEYLTGENAGIQSVDIDPGSLPFSGNLEIIVFGDF